MTTMYAVTGLSDQKDRVGRGSSENGADVLGTSASPPSRAPAGGECRHQQKGISSRYKLSSLSDSRQLLSNTYFTKGLQKRQLRGARRGLCYGPL